MFPFGGFLDSDSDDAAIVADTFISGAFGAQSVVLSTLGAIPGDMAVMCSRGGVPTSPGAGTWGTISNGSPELGNIFWKTLDAADCAGKITPSSTGGFQLPLLIIRGTATLVSVRTATTSPASGVTRDAGHAGFLGLNSATNVSTHTLTGFTRSSVGQIGPFASGPNQYDASLYYRLAPPAIPYVSGDPFVWTATGAGPVSKWLVIAELRR